MSDARAVIVDGLARDGASCITSSFQAECVVLTHLLIEEQFQACLECGAKLHERTAKENAKAPCSSLT